MLNFIFKLVELDESFRQLQIDEADWLPPPPDMMTLYRNSYRELHRRVHNMLCACCGCIGHDLASFELVPSGRGSHFGSFRLFLRRRYP